MNTHTHDTSNRTDLIQSQALQSSQKRTLYYESNWSLNHTLTHIQAGLRPTPLVAVLMTIVAFRAFVACSPRTCPTQSSVVPLNDAGDHHPEWQLREVSSSSNDQIQFGLFLLLFFLLLASHCVIWNWSSPILALISESFPVAGGVAVEYEGVSQRFRTHTHTHISETS